MKHNLVIKKILNIINRTKNKQAYIHQVAKLITDEFDLSPEKQYKLIFLIEGHLNKVDDKSLILESDEHFIYWSAKSHSHFGITIECCKHHLSPEEYIRERKVNAAIATLYKNANF